MALPSVATVQLKRRAGYRIVGAAHATTGGRGGGAALRLKISEDKIRAQFILTNDQQLLKTASKPRGVKSRFKWRVKKESPHNPPNITPTKLVGETSEGRGV